MSYDIVFFIIFLLVTLIIGIWNGRKVRDIKQYALGDKNFSTGALVATIVASWIGGDYLFITLSEVYSTGLHYAIGCLGMVLCFLMNAFVFAPRMGEYIGSLSVAESMGKLYGKHVRLITAIASTIAASGFIALQFKIFGFILSNFIGLTGDYPIFLAAAIVVIYSAFGGIKSVAFTDVFQFLTFGVLLPVLGAVIWYSCMNSPDCNISQVPNQNLFSFKEFFDISGSKFWSMLALFLLFAIPDINPPIFQRFAIGKDVAQVRRAFAYSALIIALILISMSWISFLLFSIDQNLNPSELVPYIIDHYSSDRLRLFILISVIAMCMSSADSNINSVAVILTHDFCNVLNLKIKSELFLSKIIAILLGFCSVLLAMMDYDLLPLVFMTQSFYIPIVDVPLILAVMGFKSSTRAVLIGMGASLVSVFVWRTYFMDTGIDSILPATVVNLVFFLLSHYLLSEPGGWIKKPRRYSIFNAFCNAIYSSYKEFNLYSVVKKSAPKNIRLIIMTGVFCSSSTICSMYSISNSFLSYDDKQSLIIIYQMMLAMSVFIIAYPIWPYAVQQNEMLISIAWNLYLCYVMIFSNCFIMLLSGVSESQVIILVLNILALAVLVNWQSALLIIATGICLAFYALDVLFGFSTSEIKLNSTWIIFYSIMLSTTIIVMFLKPKQEHQKATEVKVGTLETEVNDLSDKVIHYSERVSDHEKEIERLGATAQKILNNVNHELRIPVSNVMNFADMLNKSLCKCDQQQLKVLSDEFIKNSNRLSSMILNMLDLATLNAKKLELNKKTINLGVLVEERVKNCIKIYLEGKKIDFELKIHSEIFISVDSNYMQQVVDNLVINAIRFSNKGKITIQLLKKNNIVEFTITDNGIDIPKEEIYDIFTPFKMGSNTESKAEGRGVGLALCKAAIEAHNGSITAKSNGKNGATFTFTLSEGLHNIC